MRKNRLWVSRIGVTLCVSVILTLVLSAPAALAQTYPGKTWKRISNVEQAGWSREGLKAARDYAASINTAAVMIVADGRIVDEWGETAKRFNVHSIRKSFLSAMYGIHVHEGRIKLNATMEQLGIDDNEPSLTPAEKKATLHDLLKARSGIYHPALYETAGMKAARPARWSREPGTFWYYNNWDFNVLGTVFERSVKNSLFREFETRIARPTDMQDYTVDDGAYVTGADSVYPAYPFRMTARDMARFGLLFLRNGRWRNRAIIPAEWVRDSATSYSDAGPSGGYGYLWWVAVEGRHLPGVTLPEGSYSARGAGGHYILVIPRLDLVIVHRVNTDMPGRSVGGEEFGKLVRLILGAKTDLARR